MGREQAGEGWGWWCWGGPEKLLQEEPTEAPQQVSQTEAEEKALELARQGTASSLVRWAEEAERMKLSCVAGLGLPYSQGGGTGAPAVPVWACQEAL